VRVGGVRDNAVRGMTIDVRQMRKVKRGQVLGGGGNIRDRRGFTKTRGRRGMSQSTNGRGGNGRNRVGKDSVGAIEGKCFDNKSGNRPGEERIKKRQPSAF